MLRNFLGFSHLAFSSSSSAPAGQKRNWNEINSLGGLGALEMEVGGRVLAAVDGLERQWNATGWNLREGNGVGGIRCWSGGGAGQSSAPRSSTHSHLPSGFYLQPFVNDKKQREREKRKIRGG